MLIRSSKRSHSESLATDVDVSYIAMENLFPHILELADRAEELNFAAAERDIFILKVKFEKSEAPVAFF